MVQPMRIQAHPLGMVTNKARGRNDIDAIFVSINFCFNKMLQYDLMKKRKREMRSSSWAFAQVRKKVCGYIGVVQFLCEKTKNENGEEKLFHGLSKHGRKSEENVKKCCYHSCFSSPFGWIPIYYWCCMPVKGSREWSPFIGFAKTLFWSLYVV